MIKLIILFTGESCAGKDFTASVCESVFAIYNGGDRKVVVASISDAFKQRYAKATGADLSRLLNDRLYKESHRSALTDFFEKGVQYRPLLHEETFLEVVTAAADVDVLLITGMREEAPVATYAHLFPSTKLVEVYVEASKNIRAARKECRGSQEDSTQISNDDLHDRNGSLGAGLIFHNNSLGQDAAARFCKQHLLHLVDRNVQQLADMIATVEHWPRPDLKFRHILGIVEQPGGLELCVSLMSSHLSSLERKVDVIACCESGGFVFAGALAHKIGARLAIIRKAGKLPPPVIVTCKAASFITSLAGQCLDHTNIEIGANVISHGSRVLIIDDLLATGTTLCAMISLLLIAGVALEDIQIMVVVELPHHRGRAFLRQQGFGRAAVHSLLVLNGE
jgi:adenine phosphoribosyltransferase